MGHRQRGLALFCKRAIDITVTMLISIIGAPVFLLLCLLLGVLQGFPILFGQRRSGLRERPFTIYKFRTMRTEFGPDGCLVPDEERITGVGRILRRLHIDEFPQLINVLKGDMSLVGNRPLLVEHLARMTPEQRRRHLVLPGMTTLDTVRGRYNNTWEQQFEIDVWYVDNWSLWLDANIVLETIWVLLTNRDRASSHRCRGEVTGYRKTTV